MFDDQPIQLKNVRVIPVHPLLKSHTTVDVLRLDLIHPVISGNKWFKLKEYLKEAKAFHKRTILTFGGAYSNHIVATAAAAKQNGLRSIGIIRGEKPTTLAHTLQQALSLGMELVFVSREEYKKKRIPSNVFNFYYENETYIIPEGGYGSMGAEGAKDILQQVDFSQYTHLIAAVGTGTTVAGLIGASSANHQTIGISVLKNNYSVRREIENLISKENHHRLTIIHDYHFGGYAKHTKQLIDFMNAWYLSTYIPSDFVYTGKLFFAANDLIQKNYFLPNSRLLIIHSGGLQGNQSLQKGTLIF